MSTSPKQPKRRGGRETGKALLILAFSFAAVATLATTVYLGQRPATGADGCKIGQTVPDVHTIVLIDQSDALSGEQLDYVRTLILQEYLRLDTYARFSVVGLSSLEDLNAGAAPATPAVATSTAAPAEEERKLPTFSKCRIQAGSEADWKTQNPRQVAERFQRLVGNELAKTVEALKTVPPAETSPIMETIDKLASSVSFGSPRIQRRLVLISDMAQYVPGGVSHYPPKGYKFAFDGQNGAMSAQDLSSMAVRVHYVVRNSLKTTQNEDHRKFWQKYFSDSGASDVQIGWGLAPDTTKANDTLPSIRNIAAMGNGASNFQRTSGPTVEPVAPAQYAQAPPPPDPVEIETSQPWTGSQQAGASPAPPPNPARYFQVTSYSPPAPIRVSARGSGLREKPFAAPDVAVLSMIPIGESLDVVGLASQSDGYWYQVRLVDRTVGFIRADLTTSETPPQQRATDTRPPVPTVSPAPVTAAPAPAPIIAAPTPTRIPLPPTAPYRLDTSMPVYPKASQQDDEQGTVILKLCIDNTGRVTSLDTKKGSGYRRLDKATRDWAAGIRFAPATRDGQPTSVCDYELSQKWQLN